MIDCVVGGQILSAVSQDGNMSVVVGMSGRTPVCGIGHLLSQALLLLLLYLGRSPRSEYNSFMNMNGKFTCTMEESRL
jgi:hypothetical protein